MVRWHRLWLGTALRIGACARRFAARALLLTLLLLLPTPLVVLLMLALATLSLLTALLMLLPAVVAPFATAVAVTRGDPRMQDTRARSPARQLIGLRCALRFGGCGGVPDLHVPVLARLMPDLGLLLLRTLRVGGVGMLVRVD